jgi:hypothetical protein
MNTYRLRAAKSLFALVVLLGLCAAPVAWAAPPGDRILPADQYTSDKARRLATSHAVALSALNATVYHCLPWLEVQKQSIGFFRPKGATQDDRYLSMRVYIEQDPSPEFANLKVEQRASAMFSRYVGPLLRRMGADKALMADASLDGFTIILEWLKQGARPAADRPVHETIAVFITKSATADYLAGRASIGQLADGARVLGWDGEMGLGQLKLTAWDDNFVSTYKVANYEMDKGVTCPR